MLLAWMLGAPLPALAQQWAIQQWPQSGHTLHLALDTTVLWNRFCVVALAVVCHGRAIPLLWQTLGYPSASVSAELVITLLQRANRLRSQSCRQATTEQALFFKD